MFVKLISKSVPTTKIMQMLLIASRPSGVVSSRSLIPSHGLERTYTVGRGMLGNAGDFSDASM